MIIIIISKVAGKIVGSTWNFQQHNYNRFTCGIARGIKLLPVEIIIVLL